MITFVFPINVQSLRVSGQNEWLMNGKLYKLRQAISNTRLAHVSPPLSFINYAKLGFLVDDVFVVESS